LLIEGFGGQVAIPVVLAEVFEALASAARSRP